MLNEEDAQRIDQHRKLNEERRKYMYLEDEFNKIKCELEKKKSEMTLNLDEKETTILDLKKELREFKQ